jgi:hypothetical protein
VAARFFVDENDLALGRALAALRDDVVYPGHPDLAEVPRRTPDDVWLAAVGARRLVVITRDNKIRYRPVEKRMWVVERVRGFVLTGRRSQSTADSLRTLLMHWPAIERLTEAGEAGPWMYAVTQGGLRRIALEG